MSHLIKYTPWLFFILLTLPVFGQLTSDSSKKLPDYKIKWSKVDYKDGRKTIINCVEPPIIKATPKKIISAEESAEIVEKWKAKRQKIKESGGFATGLPHFGVLIVKGFRLFAFFIFSLG